MLYNYNLLVENLISKHIQRPISGALAGHAAGEPFDKLVYSEIKRIFTKETYRQYEYLNKIFLENFTKNSKIVVDELFTSEWAKLLFARGKKATMDWSPSNLFEEKQNDTADIIVIKDNKMDIIDIKTRNLGLDAQPPNIISSYKLANLMTRLIDSNDFEDINIIYIEIEWRLEGDFLVCKNVHIKDLFRADPATLYINWAAAMQIQFHVSNLEQTYTKGKSEWALEYLKNYTSQARKRGEDMIVKFAAPFEKYL